MNTPAIDAIEEIQTILHRFFPDVKVDGDIGKRTMSAMAELDAMGDRESMAQTEPLHGNSHTVKASFFAGPQDVSAFRKCKKAGGSDNFCFKSGDNGIGKWDMDCTREDRNSAALPREVWGQAGKTGGSPLSVTYHGKTVHGFLDDTMPSLANIHNGCGIDLARGFAIAFGIHPDEMNNHTLEDVTWSWI